MAVFTQRPQRPQRSSPPPSHPGALLYKSWVDESPCGYHVMRVGTPAACKAVLIWAIV